MASFCKKWYSLIKSKKSYFWEHFLNLGDFNLFFKMIREEYGLSEEQILILKHRLLADENEFEKVWKTYKNKSATFSKGVDPFRSLLQELLN